MRRNGQLANIPSSVEFGVKENIVFELGIYVYDSYICDMPKYDASALHTASIIYFPLARSLFRFVNSFVLRKLDD